MNASSLRASDHVLTLQDLTYRRHYLWKRLR
jgi:hypothetical protein